METNESNAIFNFLESNAILHIAIGVSYLGILVIIWLGWKFYDTKAFWHICILLVLMLGLSITLTVYKCMVSTDSG